MRNRNEVFVAALRRRLAQDPGFAARLRRAAGKRADRPAILVNWYSFVSRLPEGTIRDDPRSQARAQLVAGLFAMDRKQYRGRVAPSTESGAEAASQENDPGDGTEPSVRKKRALSFGATLRSLVKRDRAEDDPLARRLARLIDSEMTPDGGGTLPWQLRQLVGLVLSRDGKIDWVQLAADLDAWDAEDRRVQKRWIRDFFRITDPTPAPETVVASNP
ncbi:MAG TPA: type I-E CRISPR-associated protein Cse2/CasB [Longimicrobiales bacterium]